MNFNSSYFSPLSFIESTFTPIAYMITKWTTHYILQEIFQETSTHEVFLCDDPSLTSPCPILQVKDGKSEQGYMVFTTVRFPFKPYIITNYNFSTLDISSRKFILLHEFGHVVNNHVQMLLTAELLSLATSLLFFSWRPLSAFFIIQQTTSIILNGINERAADTFAVEKSDKEALEGGKKFLQYKLSKREENWNNATSLFSRISYLYNAFSYYVLQGHPLEEARISKIDQKLTTLKNDIPLLQLDERLFLAL